MGRLGSATDLRLALIIFPVVGFLHSRPALAQSLEASAGIHTNLDGDHQRVFGNASAFSLAYSTPLTPHNAQLMVEIGYMSNSTTALPPSDPTFGTLETRYWIVPFIAGLRTNLLSDSPSGPFGIYLGLGIMVLFTGLEDPLGTKDDASTLGGMVELRPQMRVTQALSIWLRERLTVCPDVSYNFFNVNYSGATLQLGLALGLP